jgi:hypothetical protein
MTLSGPLDRGSGTGAEDIEMAQPGAWEARSSGVLGFFWGFGSGMDYFELTENLVHFLIVTLRLILSTPFSSSHAS